MTKHEYIDKYYATDNYFLTDLMDEVWEDACDEMLKEINKLFLINQKDLSKEEVSMFYKTIEKINNHKPKLS